MQNVQSLVLASSRKKFVSNEDQLLSLDDENPQDSPPVTNLVLL